MKQKHVLAPPNAEQKVIINLVQAVANTPDLSAACMHTKAFVAACKSIRIWLTDKEKTYLPVAGYVELDDSVKAFIAATRDDVKRLEEARVALNEKHLAFSAKLNKLIEEYK